MPITGPSSYLPTIDAVTAHWADVNTARINLGRPALLLPGSRAVVGLVNLRGQLSSDRTVVEVRANDMEIAKAQARLLQRKLLHYGGLLAAEAKQYWEPAGLDAAVPVMPGETVQWVHMERALDDAGDLWARINGAGVVPPGATVPLVFFEEGDDGEYTLAEFTDDLLELKNLDKEIKPAESRLNSARSTRNKRQDTIRTWLTAYREAMKLALPAGHELLDSVPRITPLPGATPDGAEAAGVWDGALGKGVITFVASTSASVVRYELRYVSGDSYDADDENIVASVNAGDPLRFETLAGLIAPGVQASYRVYAITAEGNERGSNTVTITRPV